MSTNVDPKTTQNAPGTVPNFLPTATDAIEQAAPLNAPEQTSAPGITEQAALPRNDVPSVSDATTEQPDSSTVTAQAASPAHAKPIPPTVTELGASQAEAADGTPLTDEEQAVQSLDDTVVRSLPRMTSLWESVESYNRMPQTQETPQQPRRARTAILVGTAAALSFVAGGVVSRLSSQIPLLFPEQSQTIEKVATYTPQAQVSTPEQKAEPEPEKEPEATRTTTPRSNDMGYDTTNDVPLTTYNTAPKTDTRTDTRTETKTEKDDTIYQWNLDDNGKETITYDYDNDLVTLDYDGYTLTVPIDDLFGYDSYEPNTQNSPYPQNTPSYPYDDSTGYDTEETRDYYTWNRPRDTNGWYGTTHTT